MTVPDRDAPAKADPVNWVRYQTMLDPSAQEDVAKREDTHNWIARRFFDCQNILPDQMAYLACFELGVSRIQ